MAVGKIGTPMCKRGAEKNWYRLAATDSRVAAGTEFRAWDQVIEKVDTFRYLE